MRKRILWMMMAGMLFPSAGRAAQDFVSFAPGSDLIRLSGNNDTIVYDKAEWKGVVMAVQNLRQDLRAVTGSPCAPITVATVGKSPIAKRYARYARQLKGKWEQYLLIAEENGVVILGSDKRGTIYGIYELSRQLGVSPWYWMADAPIVRHEGVWVKQGVYTDGEPKVKYLGIFINDEWPSFGTWCQKQFGGINSKAYARIFELLLRLKANYFWPAMWGSAFNEDDPLSPQVADDVTLLFCDNNWGYVRCMGGEREQGRKGGMGMYYHIDMNGGPWNDRWVNTTTVPKLREQLNLAYRSGIDRIWIINVGDLKPKEMPIDFIMHYAWNPDAVQPGDV